MSGKRLIQLLWLGLIVQVAAQIVDVRWHASNKGFENAADQIPVHGPFFVGVILTLSVAALGIARRKGQAEHVGYQLVGGLSAAVIVASTWHFFEHVVGEDHPELAGGALVSLWALLIGGVLFTTILWWRGQGLLRIGEKRRSSWP